MSEFKVGDFVRCNNARDCNLKLDEVYQITKVDKEFVELKDKEGKGYYHQRFEIENVKVHCEMDKKSKPIDTSGMTKVCSVILVDPDSGYIDRFIEYKDHDTFIEYYSNVAESNEVHYQFCMGNSEVVYSNNELTIFDYKNLIRYINEFVNTKNYYSKSYMIEEDNNDI